MKIGKNIMQVTIILAVVSSVLLYSVNAFTKDIPINTTANVYFSPNGGCTNAIVDHILKAKKEILIQAYSFTSKPIANAIVKASKAGIKVEIILDKSNRSKKYSAGDFTADMGIPTYIDSQHAIAHNKVMILDRETVITGSFNFTTAAEKNNAENIIIIRSKELAEAYLNNWDKHRKHSDVYSGR